VRRPARAGAAPRPAPAAGRDERAPSAGPPGAGRGAPAARHGDQQRRVWGRAGRQRHGRRRALGRRLRPAGGARRRQRHGLPRRARPLPALQPDLRAHGRGCPRRAGHPATPLVRAAARQPARGRPAPLDGARGRLGGPDGRRAAATRRGPGPARREPRAGVRAARAAPAAALRGELGPPAVRPEPGGARRAPLRSRSRMEGPARGGALAAQRDRRPGRLAAPRPARERPARLVPHPADGRGAG
jgi:hypothetical protein